MSALCIPHSSQRLLYANCSIAELHIWIFWTLSDTMDVQYASTRQHLIRGEQRSQYRKQNLLPFSSSQVPQSMFYILALPSESFGRSDETMSVLIKGEAHARVREFNSSIQISLKVRYNWPVLLNTRRTYKSKKLTKNFTARTESTKGHPACYECCI